MNTRLSIKLLPSILVLISCGRDPSISQVKHDLGRTLNDSSAFQWHDTTDDEYFDVMMGKNNVMVTRSNSLQGDHEATKRVQFWIDAIDGMLRAREGDKFAGVPKPKAKVILSKEPNAFVSDVKICTDFEVAIAGSEKSKNIVDAIIFERAEKNLQTSYSSNHDLGCIKSKLSKDQQLELLKWQFAPYPECKFEVSDQMVILPLTCTPEFQYGRAKTLIVLATSNQVTFLSPIISLLSEFEMTGIIAHELAHYYAGHVLAPNSTYDMFYKLGANNPGQKPVRDPDAEVISKKLIDTFKNAVDFSEYTKVDGQRYHSVLFTTTKNMIYTLKSISCGAEKNCQKPCGILADYFKNPETNNKFESFPWGELSDEGTDAYKKYEELAKSCAETIKITDEKSSQDALTLGNIETYLGYSSANLVKIIGKLPVKENLSMELDYITKTLSEIEKSQTTKTNEVLTEAMTFNLGQYTSEQEADELSAEWLHAIGVNPSAETTAMIKLSALPIKDRAPALGEISGERCEALYKNNWLDEKGHYVMVPIAAWDDSHHSTCFRAFNIEREIKAHNLSNFASKTPPAPDGKSWTDIAASVHGLELEKFPPAAANTRTNKLSGPQ